MRAKLQELIDKFNTRVAECKKLSQEYQTKVQEGSGAVSAMINREASSLYFGMAKVYEEVAERLEKLLKDER